MRSLIRSSTLLLLLPSLVWSQIGSGPIKRELRAAWVATVQNIDWPLSRFDSPAKQQTDLTTIIDSLARVGVNAIFFQIRPSCDALYTSSIEPWSEWLTGTQGVAHTTPYDPLTLAISLARSRGMELHAWFNPYRAVVNEWNSSVSNAHISRTRPELVKKYPIYGGSPRRQTGNLVMLDPGLPEVRSYVTSVIMDVVRRYDIDGVHFDDYFYPYPTTDSVGSTVPFPDADTWAVHNPGGLALDAWRRENVNALVKMINDSINAVKPRVKFGISPFGIWANQSSNPLGSATSGLQSYSAIYADSRRWLQEGWIDYCAPQVYWNIGFSVANFSVLVPWWDANAFARHIYVGQATYRIFDSNNWPVSEIVNQTNLYRQYANVHGSIHFSAKYFQRSTYMPRGMNDSVKGLLYPYRVLRPTMAWKDAVPPNPPESLSIQKFSGFGLVRWKAPPPATDGETATEYIMYRSRTLPFNVNDMSTARFMGTALSWAEGDPLPGETIYVAVTALDRMQNESALSNIMGLTSGGVVGVERSDEVPRSVVLYQNFPNPFNPVTLISFELPEQGDVSLKVYDILGREVATLVQDVMPAGYRQVSFNASGLGSGTYFYRLVAGGTVVTKRMQVIR